MKYEGMNVTNSKTYVDLMKRYVDTFWADQKDFDHLSVIEGINTDASGNSATTTLTQVFGKVQYGYAIQSAAEVYKHTKKAEYAEIALALIGRIADIYEVVNKKFKLSIDDLDALQFIEAAFSGGPFSKGCLILREAGLLGDELYRRMQPVWESTARFAMRLPEWGPFNRCVLRVITLSRFARLYPNSPLAKEAGDLARFCAEDSIGRWTMEDTTLYNGVWYICVAEYLHENNIRNYRTDTILHYYATYFVHTQTPEGSIPDYGDARIRDWGCPALCLGFLEWAAAIYNDGFVKYSAMKLLDWGKRYYGKGIAGGWHVRSYALAADMADAKVKPEKPEYLSGEVIEDLVGKKLIWRGKEDDENKEYLMLNYRDEGKYALLARQNMFCTIPAPAEKVHHGHADENAITSYFYRDKPLLCDGGYRDAIVDHGAFRADFYHNKVVMRNGRIFHEKGFLEYAEDLGAYLKVETEKVFYQEMLGLEIGRTRMDDPHHRTVYDRTIIHFPTGGFAVIDSVKAKQTYEYTLGQMWFGGEILKCGDNDWTIAQNFGKDAMGPKGTENLKLRLALVRKDLKVSLEKLRRNYNDDQYALTQYYSEYLGEGEYIHFVTLLLPEDGAEDEKRNDKIIKSASCKLVNGNAVEFKVTVGGKKYVIGMKLDEKYGYNDHRHRPTYSFEAGKISYTDFTTDALLTVMAGNDYSALMLSRFDYKGKTLFEAPHTGFSNNDLTQNMGAFNYLRHEGKL